MDVQPDFSSLGYSTNSCILKIANIRYHTLILMQITGPNSLHKHYIVLTSSVCCGIWLARSAKKKCKTTGKLTGYGEENDRDKPCTCSMTTWL
jgi:hypothetical protein